MVNGVSRLKDHDTVIGVESFLNRIECLDSLTALHADTGKYAEALGLDVDLTLFTFCSADFITI